METESGSWGSPLVMCEEGLGASSFRGSAPSLAAGSTRWYIGRHGEGGSEGCVWKPSPALAMSLLAVKSARWYPCRHGEGCDEGCVWKPSPALGALCNLTAN